MRTPSYRGLKPASKRASDIARAASPKRDTREEMRLRKAVWALGLRYRVDDRRLAGRPDLVFTAARVAVFCDGDFWHGRHLDARLKKLRAGHNAAYWVSKIQANVDRDERHRETLERAGWLVLRYWESDIRRDVERIAQDLADAVRSRRRLLSS